MKKMDHLVSPGLSLDVFQGLWNCPSGAWIHSSAKLHSPCTAGVRLTLEGQLEPQAYRCQLILPTWHSQRPGLRPRRKALKIHINSLPSVAPPWAPPWHTSNAAYNLFRASLWTAEAKPRAQCGKQSPPIHPHLTSQPHQLPSCQSHLHSTYAELGALF